MRYKSGLPPILVVGSGRSGTTWIGETVASCSGCISVFEPMHPHYVGRTPHWGMHSRLPGPYLPANGSSPEWEAFFDALLDGRISNFWTRRDGTRVPDILSHWRLAERIGYRLAKIPYQCRALRGNRYVIKEIRANLMLDWLARYTKARVVFLTRHPCAVIGSRMRMPVSDWQGDTDEILGQGALMRDYLKPFRKIICGATTPLERHAVLWCVENLVPISHARSKDWVFCCYEEFHFEREKAFERLFRSIGLEKSSITKSAQSRVVSYPTHDVNTQRSWHAPLTEAEGEEVLRICDEFGLRLYGRQGPPLRSHADLVDSGCIRLPAKRLFSR